MNLGNLELRILTLHGEMELGATVQKAAKIGALLAEAKALLPYGGWLPWLSRIGMGKRTGQLYMQCHAAIEDNPDLGHVSFTRFFTLLYTARRNLLREEMQEKWNRTKDARGEQDYQVITSDARKYAWPDMEVIATDPPWGDMEAYRWLADLAQRKLKPDGLIMVQASVPGLQQVIDIFQSFTYIWTLALVYRRPRMDVIVTGTRFNTSWRPVLLFSNGKPKFPRRISDVMTVEHHPKTHHTWEQPLKPWVNWLDSLTQPNTLIADPFAGGATIGVAIKTIAGGRKYLGTEIDPKAARVARRRIADHGKEI